MFHINGEVVLIGLNILVRGEIKEIEIFIFLEIRLKIIMKLYRKLGILYGFHIGIFPI